eukprot:2989788-Rhodomonas_salina.2
MGSTELAAIGWAVLSSQLPYGAVLREGVRVSRSWKRGKSMTIQGGSVPMILRVLSLFDICANTACRRTVLLMRMGVSAYGPVLRRIVVPKQVLVFPTRY